MSESNAPASLGCGTLILIAVIVSIFSNSNRDVDRELRALKVEVQRLTNEINDLRTDLHRRN